jgi:hypothetical protein
MTYWYQPPHLGVSARIHCIYRSHPWIPTATLHVHSLLVRKVLKLENASLGRLLLLRST